jgi:hypothetical protein
MVSSIFGFGKDKCVCQAQVTLLNIEAKQLSQSMELSIKVKVASNYEESQRFFLNEGNSRVNLN